MAENIFNNRKGEQSLNSPLFSFDKFITFEGNMIAFNAAKAVTDTSVTSYNPLFLYGGHGTGKTHLLKAIENDLVVNEPNMSVMYVTAEKFSDDISAAHQCGAIFEIREIYRTQDVLLMDDIQILSDNEQILDELGYTIDALLRGGGQLIFSADKPPKKMKINEHIRSRLCMGLIAEMKSPDLSMKNNLVRVKANERGVLLQDDVIEFISSNVGSNIGEIEGAVTSIVAYSEMTRPVITIDIARNVLKDIIAAD